MGKAYLKQLLLSGAMTVMFVLRASGQCEGQQPGPITGVNASDGGCDHVHISWNAAERATQYYVYRDSQSIGSTSGGTSYDDYVSDGVSYYYTVSPWNACGWGSSAGDYGSAGGGTNTTVVNASVYTYCDRVHISWNPVPGQTNYEIWRDNSYLGITNGTNYDDYLDPSPGVPAGGLYKICGPCGVVYGSASGVVLSSPAELTGVDASDGTCSGYVYVTWNYPVMATGYRIKRDGNYVGSTDNTSYYDYPGDTASHSYQVIATNVCGASDPVSDVGFASPAYHLTASISGNQLVFSWNTNFLGFNLVWCTNLNVPGTNWTVATPSPVIVGSNYCVTN